MTIKYPLMRSNFSRSDLDAVIDHLNKMIQFSQTALIAVNSRKNGVIIWHKIFSFCKLRLFCKPTLYGGSENYASRGGK